MLSREVALEVMGIEMGWGNGMCEKERKGQGSWYEMLSAAGATI